MIYSLVGFIIAVTHFNYSNPCKQDWKKIIIKNAIEVSFPDTPIETFEKESGIFSLQKSNETYTVKFSQYIASPEMGESMIKLLKEGIASKMEELASSKKDTKIISQNTDLYKKKYDYTQFVLLDNDSKKIIFYRFFFLKNMNITLSHFCDKLSGCSNKDLFFESLIINQ